MTGGEIRFEQVSKRYGSVYALSGFDLTVKPGEFMTLLGASGSGKTTALNIIAGFIDGTSGTVSISGSMVNQLPPERRNIGMVFQNYSLFPHMTVFENVAFPLRLRKYSSSEIKKRVNRYLDLVHLADYAHRKPSQLSGGQRQRIAFARAVVFEPQVLLMDEPLGALDLKLREAMQAEIKHYHKQIGCTVVFVTHDQGEALTLSNRIAVMKSGSIVQVDTPEAIYDSPASEFVANFIGRTNILKLEVVAPGRFRVSDLGVEFSDNAGRLEMLRGTKASLSIRPEKIARANQLPTGAVSFAAKIISTSFMGDTVWYQAVLPQGGRIEFKESRGFNCSNLEVNESVNLGFVIPDAKILRSEEVSSSN